MLLGLILYWISPTQAQDLTSITPLNNRGLYLIEKEMIRFSDEVSKTSSEKRDKTQWSQEEKATYKSLLFLEDYFLNGGIGRRARKMLHSVIKMRDFTPDLNKKAFLDCEAWRILDHDLKNNENTRLIQKLRQSREYTQAEHVLFRAYVSKKVSGCLPYITTSWTWSGPEYEDQLYDLKARNAVKTVQTYSILNEKKELSVR